MGSDFFASLVGALVGGAIALVGVFWADWMQRRRDRAEEQKTLRGFLQALLTELETCWNRARETSNPYIERLAVDRPLRTEMFIKTDFFTVYHNNSNSLGLVRDDELRELIVATVTNYKALIETLNVNTEYYLRWIETKHLEALAEDEHQKSYYCEKSKYEYTKLEGWADAIQRDYHELKERMDKLIPALRRATDGATAAQSRSVRSIGESIWKLLPNWRR